MIQRCFGLFVFVTGGELLRRLRSEIPDAAMIGYVTEREDSALVLEGSAKDRDIP